MQLGLERIRKSARAESTAVTPPNSISRISLTPDRVLLHAEAGLHPTLSPPCSRASRDGGRKPEYGLTSEST